MVSHSKEEHRLRVFESRVPRRIFAPKREEVAVAGEVCMTGSFISCTLHQLLCGWSNQRG
jgi:hypothetical protein